jgi:hypothetical protein
VVLDIRWWLGPAASLALLPACCLDHFTLYRRHRHRSIPRSAARACACLVACGLPFCSMCYKQPARECRPLPLIL